MKPENKTVKQLQIVICIYLVLEAIHIGIKLYQIFNS